MDPPLRPDPDSIWGMANPSMHFRHNGGLEQGPYPLEDLGGGDWSLVFPLTTDDVAEGDYLTYQLTTGGLFLAAFFLATEMTCRPVTAGGQVLFGVGVGFLATVLRLYTAVPVPAYVAILVMNTFTQSIDRLWRPRIFGRPRWPFGNRRLPQT